MFPIYHGLYYAVLLITSVIAFLVVRRLKGAFFYINLLILITAGSELLAKAYAYIFSSSNSIIYHIFTPLEYILYTCIFLRFLQHQRWKKMMSVSAILLIMAEIINTIYFQPLSFSNTNIMILESVLLVFFSLILFAEIKDHTLYENLLKEGVFWFNSAVLIYYAFNILVWGFHSFKIYMLDNPPVLMYRINLIFSAVLYVIYTYANHLSIQKNQITVK